MNNTIIRNILEYSYGSFDDENENENENNNCSQNKSISNKLNIEVYHESSTLGGSLKGKLGLLGECKLSVNETNNPKNIYALLCGSN